MKKTITLLLIGLMMLTVLTGCVSVDYDIKVNKNGSGDITYIYGLDKAMIESMGTTPDEMTADSKKDAETEGYTIETYENDTIQGFKATKHFDDITSFSFSDLSSDTVSDLKNDGIIIEKKGNYNTYSQNASIDLSSLAQMGSYISIKYSVTLPTKAKENNATIVSNEGKTLTWDLTVGEVNQITFTAKETNKFLSVIQDIIDYIKTSTIAIIGLSILATLIIVLIIICIIKKVRKAKKEPKEPKVEKVEIEKIVEEPKEEEKETELEEPKEETIDEEIEEDIDKEEKDEEE